MSDIDPERPSSPLPLDYARPLPPGVRTSRLAIVSLVVAFLMPPGVVLPLAPWDSWYLPLCYLILPIALPLAAILRISLSNGTLKGKDFAAAALAISLTWWIATCAWLLFWGSW